MSITTETQTTDEFIATQTIIPAWQRAIIDAAYDSTNRVSVTRKVTPFGTFVVNMEVAR